MGQGIGVSQRPQTLPHYGRGREVVERVHQGSGPEHRENELPTTGRPISQLEMVEKEISEIKVSAMAKKTKAKGMMLNGKDDRQSATPSLHLRSMDSRAG